MTLKGTIVEIKINGTIKKNGMSKTCSMNMYASKILYQSNHK